jgi:putative Mn2+ efflux pump MntP
MVAGAAIAVAIVVRALSLSPVLAAGRLAPFTAPPAVRIGAIAFAVGLDVLALTIGIGVMGVAWKARIRVGAAFASAEIAMLLSGVAIGAGAGRLIGDVAAYLGFALLALIGALMLRGSFGEHEPMSLKATSGWGLLVASASISMDSLGVGFSLPGLGLPLMPLLATVAVTTIAFSLAGLAFGQALGARYRTVAERGCAIVLIVLAVLFTLQHAAG